MENAMEELVSSLEQLFGKCDLEENNQNIYALNQWYYLFLI